MSIVDSLNHARQRVLSGEQLSLEEQRKLIQMLRDVRGASTPVGAAKPASGGKKPKSSSLTDDELDAQLNILL